MDPGPLRDALTLLLGVATGMLSGLFGVGGAVISTPGIRALGATALTSIGTTLPSIIPSSASGTFRYAREGLIDWRAVGFTAPIGVLAAIGGSLLSEVVPGEGHLLMLATAALLGVSALRMGRARQAAPVPVPEGGSEEDTVAAPDEPGVAAEAPERARPGRFAVVGLMAGTLSGLLGIGGGIVMVPGFSQYAGLGVKRAIATSLVCVGLFAVPGTVTHAALGNIDWRFALWLAVGVVPGAWLGAHVASGTSDRRLRLVVSGFLGLTAVGYAAGELIALLD
ncbi:MAG TPA: sulfite exporter TauE/SafE family protein [Acidimicrobiales bacterium]